MNLKKVYTEKYGQLLDKVREINPNAKVVSVSAFCGGHHEALGEFIKKYNEEKGADVVFIDTFGWIPVEPLHPLRDGHKTVAQNLVKLLKDII